MARSMGMGMVTDGESVSRSGKEYRVGLDT